MPLPPHHLLLPDWFNLSGAGLLVIEKRVSYVHIDYTPPGKGVNNCCSSAHRSQTGHQKMMEWQWHQLDHMQIICTLLQTDDHASTSSVAQIFTSWMVFLTLNSVKAMKAKSQYPV